MLGRPGFSDLSCGRTHDLTADAVEYDRRWIDGARLSFDIQEWLRSTGVEHQPGPGSFTSNDDLLSELSAEELLENSLTDDLSDCRSEGMESLGSFVSDGHTDGPDDSGSDGGCPFLDNLDVEDGSRGVGSSVGASADFDSSSPCSSSHFVDPCVLANTFGHDGDRVKRFRISCKQRESALITPGALRHGDCRADQGIGATGTPTGWETTEFGEGASCEGFDRSREPIVEVKNLTSMWTHREQLVRRKADLSLFQEHSCNPSQMTALKETYGLRKMQITAGPLDPICTHQTAGVGAFGPIGNCITEIPPASDSFLKSRELGRCIHIGFTQGMGGTLSDWFCGYGYSGGTPTLAEPQAPRDLFGVSLTSYPAIPRGPPFWPSI